MNDYLYASIFLLLALLGLVHWLYERRDRPQGIGEPEAHFGWGQAVEKYCRKHGLFSVRYVGIGRAEVTAFAGAETIAISAPNNTVLFDELMRFLQERKAMGGAV